jgi:hypothetical protein
MLPTKSLVLAGAAMGLLLTGAAAIAQNTDATQPPVQGMDMHRHQPPSPETLQRLLDGRIAMMKATLQLTADQEKLWAPVEQAIRDGAAERHKMMDDARQSLKDADPIARLEFMSKMAGERASNTQKLADALKPLYATFSDGQKAVVRFVFNQMGDHMRGHMGRPFEGGMPG